MRKNAPDDSRYERKETGAGKFMFNLKAANHQVIGSSQMYASQAGREAGINSVRANGPTPTVKDRTAD